MGYYMCPACGSSVDAGEHCSCGTVIKPVYEKEEHKRIYITTEAGRDSPLYTRFKELEQRLEDEKRSKEREKDEHRKEIYKRICKNQ